MSSPYITVSQLICPAVLQLPFVDKVGDPLTNGVITFYQSDMITLKNIYYQATPGNYIAAPNPMTLSGAGTPMDVNGNDIILFYYPYDDDPLTFNNLVSVPYFVTAYDQFETLQWTRYNFPFVADGGSGGVAVSTLDNYILNNRFWRNIGTLDASTLNVPNTSTAQTSSTAWTLQYNNSTNPFYYATLAPDQHDGFSMPDFNYIKNVNGSCTETITFMTFPTTTGTNLTGDVGPEYYLNHNCVADTSGSTLKVYQFPISLHLATLTGTPFTFTIQGQSLNGGVANSTVKIYIYKFCGTNALSPMPAFQGQFTFTSTWTKFTLPGLTFPATTGVTLPSVAGDDAYYLQIALPVGATDGVCNLNFTLPSIYLSALDTELPTNSFATYDEIDTIINSPRTGDIRTSLNSFYPYGWVPMNNGTIGNSSSNATARKNIDTWPLFNLLWNAFSNFNNSTTNLLAQMVNNAGAAVTYGSSAIADFNANNAITLSQTMGQVILGTVPISAFLVPSTTLAGYSSAVTVSSNVVTVTGNKLLNLYNGCPITFTGTTTLSTKLVYYISGLSIASSPPTEVITFSVSTSFANALAGTVVTVASDSGTVYYASEGAFEGEYAHTQLNNEVGPHVHSGQSGASFYMTANSGGTDFGSTGSHQLGVTTTGPVSYTSGTQTAFNVTQPGTYFNMYIKL